MRLFVQFDAQGQIVSAGKIHAAGHGHHPFAHAHEPDLVMEVEVTPEMAMLPAHEIAEQYQVDRKTRQLRKKTVGKVIETAITQPLKAVTRKPRKTNPGKRGR